MTVTIRFRVLIYLFYHKEFQDHNVCFYFSFMCLDVMIFFSKDVKGNVITKQVFEKIAPAQQFVV